MAIRNQTAPRVGGVIFDMDGLMFDTERLAIEGWQVAGKEFGYELSDDLVLETAGRNIPDTQAILERGTGQPIPFLKMRERRMAYAFSFIEENGVPIKQGLLDLLDLLENHSVPKAVATSTERDKAMEFLRLAGVANRFEFTVCGDEVTQGKPEPDIFLAAGRGIGIDAGRCAVLEDSEAGVRAARAAGMIPLAVPDLRPLPKPVAALAHAVFMSLDEVAVFLSNQLQDRV